MGDQQGRPSRGGTTSPGGPARGQRPPPAAPAAARSGGVDISESQVEVHGDIVGRDLIVQLTTLSTSARYALAALALATCGVLLVALTHDWPAVRAFVVGPAPLDAREFNVVVTPFGEAHDPNRLLPSGDGDRLSRELSHKMDNELRAVEGIDAQVAYDETHLVTSATGPGPGGVQNALPTGLMARVFGPRETSAEAVATLLNAKLVIYGRLTTGGGATTLQPAFFVKDLAGAEELNGENYIGSQIPVKRGTNMALNDVIKVRTEALTSFVKGLDFFFINQLWIATKWFDEAKRTPEWDDRDGKWVAYLFSGTSHRKLYEMDKVNNVGELDQATKDFEAARDLASRVDDDYARAYIGLGNVYYDRFIQSSMQDPAQLDLALEQYERARIARDKPATAHVDEKLHVTIGNTYLVKAQLGHPELFGAARDEYEPVIRAYEASAAPELQELAARGYCGEAIVVLMAGPDLASAPGLLARCVQNARAQRDIVRDAAQGYCLLGARLEGSQDLSGARDAYTACLANAGDDADLRRSAQEHVDRLRATTAEPRRG